MLNSEVHQDCVTSDSDVNEIENLYIQLLYVLTL